MKRVLLGFLCLVLLLSACGKTPGPESSAAPDAETTAASEPVSSGETAPASSPMTDPSSFTEAAATEAPEAPKQPRFSGSVTAGGFRVHTDDSAYTPYSAPKPLYTRLREGPLEDFEPSPDYGAVYPYIAARIFSSGEGDGWEDGARYGFVDRSGRILTDGSYINVRALNNADMEHDDLHYLPFWVVSRVLSVTYHEVEENPDLNWLEDDTRMGLVSMDGSFALPCVYRSIQPMGEGFICYRGWEKPDFEIYGPDGSLRFTGTELFAGMEMDWWSIRCGEGIYLAGCEKNEQEDVFWFCDADGKQLLGPYQNAEPFHDGLACVSEDDEHYGYIDREGNQVIPAVYRQPASFYNGLAFQELEGGQGTVLDTTGRQILTLENCWFEHADCGIKACAMDSSLVSYYDREGRLLCRGSGTLNCLDQNTFMEYQEKGLRLFHLDGTELLVEGADYVYPGSGVRNGEVAVGYRCYNYEGNGGSGFIPADLSAVIWEQPAASSPYGSSYDSQDKFTNEIWHVTWDGKLWDLRRGDTPELRIPLNATRLEMMGERIFAITDQACAFFDLQGKLVFYYPLNAED